MPAGEKTVNDSLPCTCGLDELEKKRAQEKERAREKEKPTKSGHRPDISTWQKKLQELNNDHPNEQTFKNIHVKSSSYRDSHREHVGHSLYSHHSNNRRESNREHGREHGREDLTREKETLELKLQRYQQDISRTQQELAQIMQQQMERETRGMTSKQKKKYLEEQERKKFRGMYEKAKNDLSQLKKQIKEADKKDVKMLKNEIRGCKAFIGQLKLKINPKAKHAFNLNSNPFMPTRTTLSSPQGPDFDIFDFHGYPHGGPQGASPNQPPHANYPPDGQGQGFGPFQGNGGGGMNGMNGGNGQGPPGNGQGNNQRPPNAPMPPMGPSHPSGPMSRR